MDHAEARAYIMSLFPEVAGMSEKPRVTISTAAVPDGPVPTISNISLNDILRRAKG